MTNAKGKTRSAELVHAQIKRINLLIKEGANGRFELCRFLAGLKNSDVYKALGEDTNWEDFLKKHKINISYSYSLTHINFYNKVRSIHYKKSDAVEILSNFGVKDGYELIKPLTRPVRISTLHRNRKGWTSSEEAQFHLLVDNENLRPVEKAFKQHGMNKTENGRRLNTSSAFNNLLKHYNQLTRFASGKKGAPVLAKVEA